MGITKIERREQSGEREREEHWEWGAGAAGESCLWVEDSETTKERAWPWVKEEQEQIDGALANRK